MGRQTERRDELAVAELHALKLTARSGSRCLQAEQAGGGCTPSPATHNAPVPISMKRATTSHSSATKKTAVLGHVSFHTASSTRGTSPIMTLNMTAERGWDGRVDRWVGGRVGQCGPRPLVFCPVSSSLSLSSLPFFLSFLSLPSFPPGLPINGINRQRSCTAARKWAGGKVRMVSGGSQPATWPVGGPQPPVSALRELDSLEAPSWATQSRP